MGYDIWVDGAMTIPSDKVREAAEVFARHRLADDLKRGAYADFAEGCAAIGLDLDDIDSITDMMQLECFSVGSEFDEDQPGQIIITGTEWHVRNTDDDEWAIGLLAPYINEGNTLEFKGEDAYQWRWVIEGGKLVIEDSAVYYGKDVNAPKVIKDLVKLIYPDGKPLLVEDGDALATLCEIENLLREGGFGPQAGMNELDRLAAV